jgi:hypothetical protein
MAEPNAEAGVWPSVNARTRLVESASIRLALGREQC